MNNRQAGRRRGRGGQRPQGGAGRSDSRIDNRSRGNAPQLLEKYKNLARDAQMQGDRVNTEYYLQFADHYFRIVNEARARVEENRRQRDESDQDDDGDDNDQQYGSHRDEAPRRERRTPRTDANVQPRDERGARSNGDGTQHGDEHAVQTGEAASSDEAEVKPRKRGRPRKTPEAKEAGSAIEADRLPPSLGVEEGDGEAKPRRRRRTTRSDEEATSPAA